MAAVATVRPRVALATYDRAPDLTPDDQMLVPALDAHGVDAVPAVWSNCSLPWASFDAVVIRSCWDYHLHIAAFRDWLGALEAIGTRVWNEPATVRWNAEKRYLIDLVERGLPTIPTALVATGCASDVERIVVSNGWHRFVVKPAISASGYETHVFNAPVTPADRATITRVASLGACLVQPFADEVRRDGEVSFTFIDGVYSHATLKRRTGEEFRVQTEHGGTVERADPRSRLIDQAARALEVLPETPLYARVDGIVRGGSFLLTELELIEPELFLAYSAGAVGRLARAIASRIP